MSKIMDELFTIKNENLNFMRTVNVKLQNILVSYLKLILKTFCINSLLMYSCNLL